MASIGIGLLALGGNDRELFQIIPDHIKKSWNEWALEGLILVSVISQVVLFLLGNIRKYNHRTRIRIALWCAYLLANTVASAALGIISRTALDVCSKSESRDISKREKMNTSELMSFWAPFLLLHLGGADTITAYSLADNELWLRNFVEIVFQFGVALYILLLSWPGCSKLPILSLSVYVSGFIKCFERIQALRLANTEYLRDSMLGSPDPGPNYAKFLSEFKLKESLGFVVNVEEVPEAPVPVNENTYPEGRGKVISEAFDLFKTFRRLFVDLILAFEDRDKSQSYFLPLKSREAFSVVEIELGFAYDMLYTKACVVYTFTGFIFRVTTVLLILILLFCFFFLFDMNDYRVMDIAITLLLIATAVIMEVFAVITMLRSDWTDRWLNQHKYTRTHLVFPFLKQPTKPRWSNQIAQSDLLSIALEDNPATFLPIQKFFGIDKHRLINKTFVKVSDALKDLIYKHMTNLVTRSFDPKELCSHQGSFSLRNNDCDTLVTITSDLEFDESILVWHIATTLCYYSDLEDEKQPNINEKQLVYRNESKHISDYLLHLLIACPFMLPTGIGMIRFRDTCADAKRFYKDKRPIVSKAEACRKLLEVDCKEVSPRRVMGDRSKSVLFDGCRLALNLKDMETGRMWKVVSDVWVEILGYAATQCRGFEHNQQLRKGGEFLTHVWLLMAHLGITEQFQVSQGHARARLNVL